MSVIIPARDEASTLPLLLDDLVAARPLGAEVIVVDDHSSDDTRDIAASYDFVTVVMNDEPPPGWTGKASACQAGADAAGAEVLCFLDADVRVQPGALEAVADQLWLRGGLVSVQPWHATEQPYEQASALFGVIALMGIGAGSRSEPDGAFGPVLMTHRSDYERVGGHRSVRSEVVEDIAIARRYHDSDRSISVFTGAPTLTFRMYPHGLRTVVQGWTKNFATGAATTRLPRLAAIVVWLVAMGTAATIAWDAAHGSRSLWVAVALYGGFVAQLRVMARPVGRFSTVTFLLFPVLLAFFFFVFFRSLWCTVVRQEVSWRGRAIPLGAGAGGD